LFALTGPEKYLNTIYFAQRWFPGGLVLLLLALPLPRLKKKIPAVLMSVTLLIFTVQTTLHWAFFNQRELSGLRSSLALITPENRVLGLDYIKTSQFIRGRPFLQINAYAQAVKGADISFSFAEHGSGIVSYRIPRLAWWTPGLEWEAEKVRLSDFSHFDRVLVNALPSGHEAFGRLEILQAVTGEGRWRLYRVTGTGRE
jgi:hypothetical protein